ncbi:MAG: ABC transporter ATP-binding protein [Acholeplasmatales bacterium]|nr:MAG: ABC transporter ATP-binding protein [Acholeplasmatales bacterium]
MSILDVENLTFGYGEGNFYEAASMRLFASEHAVLVGPNGAGKTTLLKLLAQQFKPDKGSIFWAPSVRIGYLDQYATLDGEQCVEDYLYTVFKPLFDKEKTMQSLYEQAATLPADAQVRALNRAAELGEALLEANFYQIKSDIGKIVHGLGLSMDLMDTKIKHLSGGMRAKIILGKLLLDEADVLLLDEPTNFLDVKHIEWLTKFLKDYAKAFIVVSHHEPFLQAIAETVLALESGQITRYKGNFDYYVKERALRHEQQKKAFTSQRKLIEKTEDFIRKNIVRASTTKQAQSRRKMLEKLPRIQAPRTDRTYRFAFPTGRSTGRDVLVTESLSIGYTYPLVEPLSFVIMKGEKVVITGKNGIGKSTLIKTVLNHVPALEGDSRWIDTADIAYFAQESNLSDTLTPFQIIHDAYPQFTKQDVLRLLGQHGLDPDVSRRPTGTLSGGEKTKIRLALLRHQKSNVLIMDEPTNHLDAAAQEALQDALINYEGTLILVSHDQPFYQSICDVEITLFETD